MQGAAMVVGVLVVVAAVFGAKQLQKRQENAPGVECFEKVRAKLRDPETAQLVNWMDRTRQITVEVRAQNGFGAYTRVYGSCGKDGTVEVFNRKEESILYR